jgi:hypothetical protein
MNLSKNPTFLPLVLSRIAPSTTFEREDAISPRHRINHSQKTRSARSLITLATTLCCATVALPTGCDIPEDDTASPIVDGGTKPRQLAAVADETALDSDAPGFRIPVDFKPECEHLRKLSEPPADLKLGQFYGCLTDESFQSLDRMYRKSRKVESTAPTLASFSAKLG